MYQFTEDCMTGVEKIDEEHKKVIVYAVVDQRQDYLNIIRGLQNLLKFGDPVSEQPAIVFDEQLTCAPILFIFQQFQSAYL